MDFSFPNILDCVFYNGNGFLISQKWQKCYRNRHISSLQMRVIKNYIIESSIKVQIESDMLSSDPYFEQSHISVLKLKYW